MNTIVGTPPPPFWGLVFEIFKKRGSSDFSHKKGRVGEIGGCFNKGGITYFRTK